MEAVIVGAVASLLGVIIGALGLILILVIQGLLIIASFQDFINMPAVIAGWVMIRDISNMFFVVVLIIIAFGTILHIESYNYKKWLPKLILMAVLINFSKTICGLLIDISQVVMLTFVNAFKDIGGANLTDMLGITDILKLSGQGEVSIWVVIGSYVLGMIYLLIAIVVVVTIAAMLAMRLVMLWIYIVLSPLAYLMQAFPGGARYAQMWWTEFTKNLISGPVLAFFLWFAFFVLSASNKPVFDTTAADANATLESKNALANGSTLPTTGGTPNALVGFIVGIGMLLAGMKISAEVGGAAGSIAGKGMAKINAGKTKILNKAKGVGMQTSKKLGRSGLGLASYSAQKLGEAGGNETLASLGKVGLAWRRDSINVDKKKKQEKRQQFLKKIGMREESMGALDDFQKTEGGKKLSTAMHTGGAGAYVGMAMGGPLGAAIGAAIAAGLGSVGVTGANKLSGYNRKKAEGYGNAAAVYESKINEINKPKLEAEKEQKEQESIAKNAKEELEALPEDTEKEKDDYRNNKNKYDTENLAAEKAKQELDTLSKQREPKDPIQKRSMELKKSSLENKIQEHSKNAEEAKAKMGGFEQRSEKRKQLTETEKTASEKAKEAKSRIEQFENDPQRNKMLELIKQRAAESRNEQAKYSKRAKKDDRIASFTSETTQKAAAEGCKKIREAKQSVKNLAAGDGVRAIEEMMPSDFYAGGEELADQLLNGSGEAKAALDNMAKYAEGLKGKEWSKRERTKIESFAQMIAASEKGGANVSNFGKLRGVVDELLPDNKKTGAVKNSVKTYFRGRSAEMAEGAVSPEDKGGKLYVNTFANNVVSKIDKETGVETKEMKTEGKDIIGTDFNKLKKRLKESNPELAKQLDENYIGANISKDPKDSSAISAVCEALVKEIKEAKTELEKNKGTMDEKEYNSRQSDLNKAQDRLSKPENIKDLSFVNTAHPSFKREQVLATAYHEQIHSSGLEDEDLTEAIARSLAANGLGRNNETGGRHAPELGKMANEQLKSGMSKKDVAANIDQEIARRANLAGRSSSAQKTVAKELEATTQKAPETSKKSDMEKETTPKAEQASSLGGEKSDTPEFDARKIEEAMNALPKEIANLFQKIFKSAPKAGGIISLEMTNRLLRMMNNNLKKMNDSKKSKKSNNLTQRVIEDQLPKSDNESSSQEKSN